MNTIKNIVFYVLYLIVSIIKFPIGLAGLGLLWIESIHIRLLAYLVEWMDDYETSDSFNDILDNNVDSFTAIAERWYLPMKIEL